MVYSWPPSPSVEDETIALAREYGLQHPEHPSKHEDQPAPCRGSVDQYPIILDSASHTTTNEQHQAYKKTRKEFQSSDESIGPPTPPPASKELRYVFIPSSEANDPVEKSGYRTLQRSKSMTPLETDLGSRGRPDISRNTTNLGDDLQEMITGRRRAPSPYAFRSEAKIANRQTLSGERQNSFLSPVDATFPRSFDRANKKPNSTGPEPEISESESSDYEHQSKTRKDRSKHSSTQHRHHRAEKARSEDEYMAELSEHQSKTHSRRSRQKQNLNHSDAKGARTAPCSPKGDTTSSYHSKEEDSRHFQDPSVPRQKIKEVSHISEHVPMSIYSIGKAQDKSSSLQSHSRTNSRRSSPERKTRPILKTSEFDKSDLDKYDKGRQSIKVDRYQSKMQHHDAVNSATSTNPKIMEEYFEKAFQENQKKDIRARMRDSAHPSPLSSPRISPPRTPRGDRRSKDFFELASSTVQPAKQRSRAPSGEETSLKDLKPFTSLLEAATAGAASHTTKAMPNLSRSSSTSIETPSSGSQTRTIIGQSSRNSPLVFEEPRPLSRSNSAVPNEQKPIRTSSTFPIYQSNHIQHTNDNVHVHEGQRPLSRAFSYTTTTEPNISRPALLTRTQTCAPSKSGPTSLSPTSAVIPPRLLTLPPCPRSRPTAGLNDWYTIYALPHLDFCPSCMATLSNSQFRDYFIPSLAKDHNQRIACAMSSPWIRLGWLQTINQNMGDLKMVHELGALLPRDTRPCPGAGSDVRQWWHLTDPKTDRPVPGFDICSACVRNVDVLFPELRSYLFDRPKNKLSQERVCNFNVTSKYFPGLINELDRLAGYRRSHDLRPKDIQAFVDYVRKVSRFRECARDIRVPTNAWHFMADLPEFTVCEECFDEVVWPVRDKPIARDISKVTKVLPLPKNGYQPLGASCQLYSDRMRAVFVDAVTCNDFELLKRQVKLRYETEQRVHEMQRLIDQDLRVGTDRRTLAERHLALWKSVE